MIYAILAPYDGIKRPIRQLLDVDAPLSSLADVKALNIYTEEEITWQFEDMIAMPNDIELNKDWVYNTETAEFEATQPRQPILSKLALIQRLEESEQILLFFPDDAPNVPAEAKLPLKLFAKQIELANYIDVDRPDTVAGLQRLESLGLLAAGRVNAIRGLS